MAVNMTPAQTASYNHFCNLVADMIIKYAKKQKQNEEHNLKNTKSLHKVHI